MYAISACFANIIQLAYIKQIYHVYQEGHLDIYLKDIDIHPWYIFISKGVYEYHMHLINPLSMYVLFNMFSSWEDMFE